MQNIRDFNTCLTNLRGIKGKMLQQKNLVFIIRHFINNRNFRNYQLLVYLYLFLSRFPPALVIPTLRAFDTSYAIQLNRDSTYFARQPEHTCDYTSGLHLDIMMVSCDSTVLTQASVISLGVISSQRTVRKMKITRPVTYYDITILILFI